MELLLLAIILIVGVESQLSSRDDVPWRPFGQQCSFIRVINTQPDDQNPNTLQAYCGVLWDEEAATLNLNECVGNEDGGLVWRKDGEFSSTCEMCIAFERQTNVWLQCWCTRKDGQKADLDTRPMLNLNEKIEWTDEGLRCVL